MDRARKALKWTVGAVLVGLVAIGLGMFAGAAFCGCCACPECDRGLDVRVEVDGGWTSMQFWGLMYADCLAFAQVYRAWESDCGFMAERTLEECVGRLWERGVPGELCVELEAVYMDNLSTVPTWCHESNRGWCD